MRYQAALRYDATCDVAVPGRDWQSEGPGGRSLDEQGAQFFELAQCIEEHGAQPLGV